MISNTQQNIVKYLKITFNIRLNTPITFFNVQLNIFKYFSYPAEYLQISKNNIQYSIKYPNHFLQYPTKRFQIFQLSYLPSFASLFWKCMYFAYDQSLSPILDYPISRIIPSQNLYPIFAFGDKFSFCAFWKDLFEPQIGKILIKFTINNFEKGNLSQIYRGPFSIASI